MTFGIMQLGGGLSAIAVAVYLWRLTAIATYIKMLAIGSALLGGASMLGIVEITVNWAAAGEAGEFLLDLLRSAVGV